MTTLTDHRVTGAAIPPRTPAHRLGFPRLVRVESRKLVDTRAGLWLLVVIGLVTAAAIALVLFTAEPAALTFPNLALTAALPQAMLLPVLGVLTGTSEWSQRTGLVTFTLEPRRLRVGAAKVVAATLVALLAVVVALAVGALANLAGLLWLDGDGSWSLPADQLGGAVLLQVLAVVQGVAFGAAVGASAPAIVAVLLLPTLWSVLAALVSWLEAPARWLDLSLTSGPLLEGTMQGADWARLTTSVALWVVLPLLVGAVRLVRREVS